MGLFSWLSGKNKKPSGIHAELPGPGDFEIEVVGTSKYQRALESAAGGRSEDGVEVFTHAILVFENDNPHDSSAVQVFLGSTLVGYLSRTTRKATGSKY